MVEGLPVGQEQGNQQKDIQEEIEYEAPLDKLDRPDPQENTFSFSFFLLVFELKIVF